MALIVFATAAFGLTREWDIVAFNWGMGITVLLWLLGHLFGKRPLRAGWMPVIFCGLILFYGWCLTGLGWLQVWTESQDDVPNWVVDLALNYGVYYPDQSTMAMMRTSVLLGAFLMTADIFHEPFWSRAMLLTLAITAGGTVAFFFLQKLSGTALVLKSEDGRFPLSFATFRYWGNAASFLNLLWPLLAAIAVRAGLSHLRGWSVWMVAAIMAFSALYINVSKAGHVLGVIGLILFLGLAATSMRKSRRLAMRTFSWRILSASAIAIVALAFILFHAIRWDRWEYLEHQSSQNDRLIGYRHFVDILPDSGWLGFGPGSFDVAHYSYIKDDPIVGRLPYWVAHQDYLQTLIEWGYAGTFLWALLLVPATGGLLMTCLRGDRPPNDHEDDAYSFTLGEKLKAFVLGLPGPQHPLVLAGALTAILLTGLHALVDFPMQIQSLQFYFLIWIALGWQTWTRKIRSDDTDS